MNSKDSIEVLRARVIDMALHPEKYRKVNQKSSRDLERETISRQREELARKQLLEKEAAKKERAQKAKARRLAKAKEALQEAFLEEEKPKKRLEQVYTCTLLQGVAIRNAERIAETDRKVQEIKKRIIRMK
jgi:hypothetical protein